MVDFLTNGNDVFYGSGSRDIIIGMGGNDRIYGRDGNDSIHGEQGNDTLYGENGDDSIFGEDGDDIIYGGPGRDDLGGGAGNDYISSGGGGGTFRGGPGSDVFAFEGRSTLLGLPVIGGNVISDFSVADRLYFPNSGLTINQILTSARTLGNGTYIDFHDGGFVYLENYPRSSLVGGQIFGARSSASSTQALGGTEAFGAVEEDAFSFDLDALIDTLAPRDGESLKGDSLAAAEPLDAATVFAQSGAAEPAASFDFISASHLQSLDHSALLAIA